MSDPKPGTLGGRMREVIAAKDPCPEDPYLPCGACIAGVPHRRPLLTTEIVTMQRGDDRLVVHLPVSVDLLAIILAGVDARHPGSRTIDTGREDVLVVELAPEIDG